MEERFYPSRKLLMLPGPTNVPERIMHSMIKPMINHRGPEFHELYRRIMEKAGKVFQSDGEIVVLTASGTGGVEAAALNVIKQGDEVVVPVFGEFGNRIVNSVKGAGGKPIRVDAQMGNAPEPSEIEEAFKRAKAAKALFLTYNDTSPGVTYRWLDEASKIAKEHGAFVVVDAMSILGGDHLPQDRWNIDLVIAGSQKCLALPPGISLLSVSNELKEYMMENPPTTTIYFDLTRYFKFNEKLEIPFTPAIPLFYALDEALTIILEEGLERRIERHRVTAKALYRGLEEAGVKPFVEERVRSNTVIAATYPSGISDAEFRRILNEEYGVVVAGGFGDLKGRIFRVGNMGETNARYVLHTLAAMILALLRLGHDVNYDRVLDAAYEELKPLLSHSG